jgi:hypothetical protein
MGGLPALDSLHRVPPPDTPPELISPSATSFSSRSSPLEEQAAWGPRAPVSLTAASMSHYGKASIDMSSESNTEGSRGRQESVGSSSVRQQLPSLSSLLAHRRLCGPSAHHRRNALAIILRPPLWTDRGCHRVEISPAPISRKPFPLLYHNRETLTMLNMTTTTDKPLTLYQPPLLDRIRPSMQTTATGLRTHATNQN